MSSQYQKSDKITSNIYAGVESLIKRIKRCTNNFEKSSTTKEGRHISCGYSRSTIWTFEGRENKNDIYRSEDCMKKFLKYLEVHALNIVNFEKKITPSTNIQQELYEKTKICNICKKRSNKNTLMIKTIVKLKTLVMILTNTEVLHIVRLV